MFSSLLPSTKLRNNTILGPKKILSRPTSIDRLKDFSHCFCFSLVRLTAGRSSAVEGYQSRWFGGWQDRRTEIITKISSLFSTLYAILLPCSMHLPSGAYSLLVLEIE